MLTVVGRLNTTTIATMLKWDPTAPTCVIDLAGAGFVEPAGLVTIAALADRARREGMIVEFTSPNNESVKNYLSRMKLGDILDELGIDHGLPTVRPKPLAEDLLELRKFSSEFDGGELAALVYDKVDGLDVDPQVPVTLQEGLAELAGNVTLHAEVAHGYAAAQTFPNGGSPQIMFAVADGGRGVSTSLKAGGLAIETDESALRLAVEPGVSGTGEKGRGNGLPDVVSSTVGLAGLFFMTSGHAWLTRKKGITSTEKLLSVYPGTLIQSTVSCKP